MFIVQIQRMLLSVLQRSANGKDCIVGFKKSEKVLAYLLSKEYRRLDAVKTSTQNMNPSDVLTRIQATFEIRTSDLHTAHRPKRTLSVNTTIFKISSCMQWPVPTNGHYLAARIKTLHFKNHLSVSLMFYVLKGTLYTV